MVVMECAVSNIGKMLVVDEVECVYGGRMCW